MCVIKVNMLIDLGKLISWPVYNFSDDRYSVGVFIR